jgi:hypothetical protein
MSGDVVVHRAEGRTAHGGAHREFKSSPIGGVAQASGSDFVVVGFGEVVA